MLDIWMATVFSILSMFNDRNNLRINYPSHHNILLFDAEADHAGNLLVRKLEQRGQQDKFLLQLSKWPMTRVERMSIIL